MSYKILAHEFGAPQDPRIFTAHRQAYLFDVPYRSWSLPFCIFTRSHCLAHLAVAPEEACLWQPVAGVRDMQQAVAYSCRPAHGHGGGQGRLRVAPRLSDRSSCSAE